MNNAVILLLIDFKALLVGYLKLSPSLALFLIMHFLKLFFFSSDLSKKMCRLNFKSCAALFFF